MSNDNGDDPLAIPLSEEEAQAQAQFQAVVMRTAMLAMGGCAQQVRGTIPENTALNIAAQVTQAMPNLGQALHDMADPKAREANPYWGYRLTAVGGTIWPGFTKGMQVGAVVPKDSALLKDPQDVTIFMICMMICLTPTVHAWCAYNGMNLEIFQTAQVPQKQSSLILPH